MLVTLESLINDNININDEIIDMESLGFDIADTIMECSELGVDINTLTSGITCMENLQMENNKVTETIKLIFKKFIEFLKSIGSFIKKCIDKLLILLKFKPNDKITKDTKENIIRLIETNDFTTESENNSLLSDDDIADLRIKNVENVNYKSEKTAASLIIKFINSRFNTDNDVNGSKYSNGYYSTNVTAHMIFIPFNIEVSNDRFKQVMTSMRERVNYFENKINTNSEIDISDDDIKQFDDLEKSLVRLNASKIAYDTNVSSLAKMLLDGYTENDNPLHKNSNFIKECKTFNSDLEKVKNSIQILLNKIDSKSEGDDQYMKNVRIFITSLQSDINILISNIAKYVSFMNNIHSLFKKFDQIFANYKHK